MANLVQLGMLEGLDGVLLVDKPAGIAFSTVVKTVKRKFGIVKVGHGGSLDAAATGLFVLLFNDANKFVDSVMGADREYEGTLCLGRTTDTGDANGRPMECPVPTPISELKGDIFQTEPRFSAIRREGTAEYEVVDTGEHAPFLGHVYQFVIGRSENVDDSVNVPFSLKATKNVLPRALAQALGATLLTLRRTRIGNLSVDDAIAFDRLLDMELKDFPACVKPISSVLR